MSRETQAQAPRQAAAQARRPGTGRSPRAVLIVMCAGYFLVLLDVTIVNVALPQIRSGLATGVTGLQWVVDGYALPLAALMLAGGTVGDLRGHKRIVQAGFAVFGAASLGCGLAPGVAVLVAARVVQGAGAALLLPGTLAIISHAFPRGPAQARAIGIWAGLGSLALPAGPLLGGALIAAFGWRAIFLINVPIVIAVVAAAQLVVAESTGPRTRRLDLPGVLLGGLFLLAMVFAVIQGGRAGAASPAVIAAALVAAAALAAFGLAERRRGEQAMLPLALLRRPVFLAANGAAGIMNLATLGTLFVLTLFLQSVHGYQPLTAGLALVPLFAPLAVLAPAVGRLTSRVGPKLPVAAGFVLAGAGLALLTVTGPRSPYLVLLPAFLLWGVGMGFVTPAVVAAAIAAVPAGRAGLASGINNTARQAGGAVGIALAGAIAGPPGPGFVPGFHVVAAAAACLYLATAGTALALIPGRVRPGNGQVG